MERILASEEEVFQLLDAGLFIVLGITKTLLP